MRPFDRNGEFYPVEESGGLRGAAIRGVGVTVVAQACAFVLQLLATLILARLLTPADFGVVTMVTTFSLLLTNFGLNGFTEALVQRPKINQSLVTNIFWINLVGGLLLTLGFAAAGTPLALFFHDARVASVAVGISLTIFFTSLSVQHLALLKRAMLFPLVSANDILSRFVSVIVSIACAWAGWGYWALVMGVVALPITNCIGAWVLCRWIPGLPKPNPDTLPLVKMALNVYGFFSANYMSRNADNLIVGWKFGSSSLGFYKRAYDLFVLPANQLLYPVSAVALPTLSRVSHDSEKYRYYLLRSLTILAFVGMGLGAYLTLIGRDLVYVLLGSKWNETGKIFMLFGPGIGAMFLYGTWSWIHLSIGRADRCFRWGILESVVTTLLFLAAVRWGPSGIAVAWTMSFWVLAIPAFWYAGRPIHFRVGAVVRVVWRYVLAAASAGLVCALILRKIPFFVLPPSLLGAVVRILLVTLLLGCLYLGAVALLHGGIEPLRQFAKLVPELLPWNRASNRSGMGSDQLVEVGVPVAVIDKT